MQFYLFGKVTRENWWISKPDAVDFLWDFLEIDLFQQKDYTLCSGGVLK